MVFAGTKAVILAGVITQPTTHRRETEAQQGNLAKARKSSPFGRPMFYELAACALCVEPGSGEGLGESGPNQQ